MNANLGFRECQKGGFIAFVITVFLLVSFGPLAFAEESVHPAFPIPTALWHQHLRGLGVQTFHSQPGRRQQ
jgi:hypothetical protein